MSRPRSNAVDSASPIASAIKELRQQLGMTQAKFASAAGIALATLARYETGKVPDQSILYRFSSLAESNGLKEQAKRFQQFFFNQAGARTESVLVEGDWLVPKVDPQTPDELNWCAALLRAFRRPQYRQELARAQKALEKPFNDSIAILVEAQGDRAKFNSRIDALISKAGEGIDVHEIARQIRAEFGLDPNETPGLDAYVLQRGLQLLSSKRKT